MKYLYIIPAKELKEESMQGLEASNILAFESLAVHLVGWVCSQREREVLAIC